MALQDANLSSKPIASAETLGLLLGLVAVSAFALTLPITRYLTGTLSVWDIGLGRSLVAGVAALVILIVMRQPIPTRRQIVKLLVTASGIAFGFPLLTALGMQSVPASHGGIVLGGLPLATAIIGCFLSGERPSVRFWLVALLGFALVVAFSLISQGASVSLDLYIGDIALIGAVIMAGLGYAQGGMLARELGGWQVICWTLVVALPLLLVATVLLGDISDYAELGITGWSAFLFHALVNSLIGFFFWYRGLAIGGIARVSQVQLLQPFLTFLFAVLFLGERLDLTALLFTAAIIAVVILGKKTPVRRA